MKGKKLFFCKKVINYLLFLFFASSFLFFWVSKVGPSPEPEALERVYWPVLEYLRLAREIGNDYFFIVPKCFRLSGYPAGVALFAWLFAAFGLHNVVLSFPWFFTISLIIPFCSVPLFRKISSVREFWLLASAIFFYPFSQLCLKQFSLHAWSVIYAFVGVLFLRSWLLKPKMFYLAGFCFCLFVASAVKHLGFLLFGNIVLVYLFWALYTRQRVDHRVIIAFFISAIFAALFYSRNSLFAYSNQQTHVLYNPDMGISGFAFWAVFFPVFFCGITLLTNFYSDYRGNTKFCRNGWVLLCFSLFCTIQMLFDPSERILSFLVLCGIVLSVLFGFFTELRSVRSFFAFLALNSFVSMSLLFASQTGRVSHVFFFPLLLMLFMTFSETRGFWKKALMVVIFFSLSNFMPPVGKLEPIIGRTASNNMIFVFYNTFQNPLSWQKCLLADAVTEVQQVLKRRKFAKPPLFLVQNVKGMVPVVTRQFEIFDENLLFNIPPIKIHSAFTQRSGGRPYSGLVKKWRQEGDGFIKGLIIDGYLPLALRVKKKLPSWGKMPGVTTLRKMGEKGGIEFEKYLGEPILTELLNEHIFYLLDSDKELRELYNIIPVPSEKAVFADFYFLKSLPEQEPSDEPNDNLRQLIEEYKLKKGG